MRKMDKFINKENIIIIVAVITILVQSNYFATKLDLANIKLEMSEIKQELRDYSDKGDKDILQNVETKFNVLSSKIDKLR